MTLFDDHGEAQKSKGGKLDVNVFFSSFNFITER